MIKVISLIVIVVVAFAAKPDCDKLVVKTESCLKASLRLDTLLVPKNLDEFKAYNQEYLNSIKCMKNYRQCLKGLARQSYGLVLNGIVKHGKYMFGKQSNATGILHSLQCFKPKTMKIILDKILTFAARVDYTLKNATSFDECCCAARMMEAEVMASINKDTCKSALREAQGFARRMMNAFLDDALNLICSKQANVEVCDSDYPSVMATLRALDVKKHRSNEFVIRPLLRMVTKLTE